MDPFFRPAKVFEHVLRSAKSARTPFRLLAPATLRVASLATLLIAITRAPSARAALLVDDFESRSGKSSFGGAYDIFHDDGSTITPSDTIGYAAGHASASSGTFAYQLGSSVAYPYGGTALALAEGGANYDLSDYAGVRFWIKGTGSFHFSVTTAATLAEGNDFEAPLAVTSDFRQVEIPFASLVQSFGTVQSWDPATAISLNWFSLGAQGDQGQLFLDDVELFTAGEETVTRNNPVVAEPKVNQLGYTPRGPKAFTIVMQGDVQPGGPFQVRDSTSGRSVFSGKLEATPIDEQAAAGESVLRGDFSRLDTPGTYVVAVGTLTSPPFSVGPDLYRPLYRDAARAFYLIRSGTAIDDAETGIAHAASHTNLIALRDQPEVKLDLSGGWYNAGDFGEWVPMAAISVSYMMWLYELQGHAVGAISLGIPESNNSVPDLLDQARFGLEWLLKMQMTDDGRVYHKIDSEPNFAWGDKPEDDPNTRTAADASSIDAADFVAVMHQAERVFASIDPDFSQRCRAAADSAWAWLRSSPDIPQMDPYYTDSDTSQERLWALSERARATRDPALATELESSLASLQLDVPSWMTPELFGILSVAEGDLPGNLKRAARTSITALADTLLLKGEASGYGVALGSAEYYWGSADIVLNSAAALFFAHALSNDEKYWTGAAEQLDYMLGRNSLNQSFVTGYGANPVKAPYHWTMMALGKLMPGWASPGPNSYPDGVDTPLLALQKQGTPPAKCYLDLCTIDGSWGSNEGQTEENAALLFATGYSMSTEPKAAEPPSSSKRGCQYALAPIESGRSFWVWAAALTSATAFARRHRAKSDTRSVGAYRTHH